MKNILFIIAPENFRDEELWDTKEVLESVGAKCTIASTKKGVCKAQLGKDAESELALDEVDSKEFDGIVFVGGQGTPIIRSQDRAIELIKEFYEQRKVIAAICWAPTILAKAGILKGLQATVWVGNDPEYSMKTNEVLEKFGATFLNAATVRNTANRKEENNRTYDTDIITANGPAAAKEFGRLIGVHLGLIKVECGSPE